MSNRLGSAGDVRFVQLPHPGKEHNVDPSGLRPWPPGNEAHRRTFIQSRGRYRTTRTGSARSGDVAFWGEWEGAARLITELERVPEGPRYLCKPKPQGRRWSGVDGAPPQNTDPFVWGDTMAYIGCRQPTNKKLRGLGRGSLVLFGSNLRGRFVLDTALVVAGWVEHDCHNFRRSLRGVASDVHMRAGLTPFHGWGKEGTLRYYAGATPKTDVLGMYSFVPCRPASGSASGFARPTIELNGLIEPNLRQQARCSEPLARAAVVDLWRSVVGQVLDQKLALATRLDLGSR